MILKLKVQFDSSERKYKPTNVFLINDFINFYEFKPILTEVSEFINLNNIEPFLNNKNEVHFNVDKTSGGYVNLGARVKFELSEENIKTLVCDSSDMTIEEIFAKTRKREYVIPRAVIYAASMYFCGISCLKLMKYGSDHTTVLNSVNKTLPVAVNSGDKEAIRLVGLLANKFECDEFYEYCKTYRSGRGINDTTHPVKYHGVQVSNNRFKAVCVVDGKPKQIGTYETRFAAQQAYYQYLKK